MRIQYDNIADAIYFYLKDSRVAKTIKLKDRLIVDLDRNGNILGIELLNASSQIPKNKLGQVEIGLPVAV